MIRSLRCALVLAPLALVACDGTRSAPVSTAPTNAVTSPPAIVAVDPSDASLRSALEAHGRLQPQDRTRPTLGYNDAYENCLFVMAASGATRGSTKAEPFCDGIAKAASQSDRPAWSDPLREYFACLFFFTVRGAGSVSEDIRLVCHGPARNIAN